MNMLDVANKNLLLKVRTGSHAYGTSLPTSDVDYRGIFCAEPQNIRTPFFPVKEVIDDTEEDTKYYELSQFMKLYLNANPNILELLWIDDENDVVFFNEYLKELKQNRANLLSTKVAHTFTGYAFSQLNKIKASINSTRRTEIRQNSIDTFGYDTKNAMHLVRLLRMGLEVLRDGVVNVKRLDADELLDVRNGKWKLNELIEYAEYMDNQVREVWYKKSNLPKTPNYELASQILINIQDKVWQTTN